MSRSRASSVTAHAKPQHNLPSALSTFVGRDRELRETQRLLRATRLLTLIGAGGVGKTRLALQLAGAVLEDHPDGLWLVDLTPVVDPRRLAHVVAGVLGLRERGTPLLHLVADALQGKRVLLILDNCEHVLEACARLVEHLLRTCPDLRVLATSRAPLRMDGEQLWRVPSLALPEPPDTPERVARSAAVELFVARAAAAEPRFTLDSQAAPAIASICRRLDGIPLALELAASRVGSLSVEQIAVRLTDRFALLVGGHRTAPPRQQTLLGTLEWSHELLSAAERVLFRRLSVFSGGWTLDAAEVVCAGDDLDRREVLGLLTRLVDTSLVVVEPGLHGDRRYRLLETIRAYAHKRLTMVGGREVQGTRERHTAHFLGLAEAAYPDLSNLRFGGWLDQLERDHDNFRTALDWLTERNRVEEALRLSAALAWFWYARGYASEGRERLERLLALPRPVTGDVRVRALAGSAYLAWSQGDYEAQYRLNAERRDLCQALRDVAGACAGLRGMGGARYQQGRYVEARALLDECVALCERHGLPLPPRTCLTRANTALVGGQVSTRTSNRNPQQ